jgi:hypothetical protein
VAQTYSLFDVGQCNCGPGTCNATFIVSGCSSLPQAGVTVSCNGASGTTNSSGQVTLNVGSAGTYTTTVTGMSSRFAAFSQSISIACASTHNLTLTAATGFVCPGFGCLLPVATTLDLTTSGAGNFTVTFDSAIPGWGDGGGNNIVISGGGVFLSLASLGLCEVSASITCPPSFELSWDIPAGECFPDALTATATE